MFDDIPSPRLWYRNSTLIICQIPILEKPFGDSLVVNLFVTLDAITKSNAKKFTYLLRNYSIEEVPEIIAPNKS